jgi:hypothetical protein
MTNQHPITPPLELLNQWEDDWFEEHEHVDVLLIQAFQAGADAELKACCKALDMRHSSFVSKELKNARRPKPAPNLKERALEAARIELDLTGRNGSLIIRALESLPDETI